MLAGMHAAEPRRDIGAFAGEALDEAFRDAILETEAQDVRRP